MQYSLESTDCSFLSTTSTNTDVSTPGDGAGDGGTLLPCRGYVAVEVGSLFEQDHLPWARGPPSDSDLLRDLDVATAHQFAASHQEVPVSIYESTTAAQGSWEVNESISYGDDPWPGINWRSPPTQTTFVSPDAIEYPSYEPVYAIDCEQPQGHLNRTWGVFTEPSPILQDVTSLRQQPPPVAHPPANHHVPITPHRSTRSRGTRPRAEQQRVICKDRKCPQFAASGEPQTFGRQSDLNRHIRTIHEVSNKDKKYCKTCNKSRSPHGHCPSCNVAKRRLDRLSDHAAHCRGNSSVTELPESEPEGASKRRA